MLSRVDDVMLMAYVDGEIDSETAHEIERAIAKDPGLARRARAMRDSSAFARAAFAEALHEPVPDRLLAVLGAGAIGAAAAGAAAAQISGGQAAAATASNVVPFAAKATATFGAGALKALAASVVAVVVGAGVAYQQGWLRAPVAAPAVTNIAANDAQAVTATTGERWLDHVAGFYREYATAQQQGRMLVDFTGDHIQELEQWFSQRLNRQIHVPDLTAHGFSPQGGRMLIINGKPAAHLVYVGRTGEVVAVVIAFSEGPNTPGRAARRDNVNIVYWREQGYSYAFVGTQPPELLWRMADQTWSALAPI
jgi:anti-sigma factor RsiW